MGSLARTLPLFVALIVAGSALTGCTKILAHRGYTVDPLLTRAISPGVDNRASVETTLGRPTFVGQFSPNEWYYVSRNTRQLAFATPKAYEQTVLRVTFDAAGNVAAVDETGIELARNLSPNGDKTPTRGKERSFFEELFGNIGAVGVPGAGGAPPQQ